MQIADTAYNYAAALTQAGRYLEAREALQESQVEAGRAKSPMVDIVTLEARVARLQGDLDAAAALADSVLRDKAATPEQRLQAYLVKGQVAAARKDSAAASVSTGWISPIPSGRARGPAAPRCTRGSRAPGRSNRGDGAPIVRPEPRRYDRCACDRPFREA